MIKNKFKYFSFLLILLILNSNFSFAVIYQTCKMDMDKKECACPDGLDSKTQQFTEQEPSCCKIQIKDLNNSNTLETNKVRFENNLTAQPVIYFSVTDLNYISHFVTYISLQVKPPADLPVLFSHILI